MLMGPRTAGDEDAKAVGDEALPRCRTELALQLDLPDMNARQRYSATGEAQCPPRGVSQSWPVMRRSSMRSTSRIVDAIAEYPPDVAIPHLTYLVLNAAAD